MIFRLMHMGGVESIRQIEFAAPPLEVAGRFGQESRVEFCKSPADSLQQPGCATPGSRAPYTVHGRHGLMTFCPKWVFHIV